MLASWKQKIVYKTIAAINWKHSAEIDWSAVSFPVSRVKFICFIATLCISSFFYFAHIITRTAIFFVPLYEMELFFWHVPLMHLCVILLSSIKGKYSILRTYIRTFCKYFERFLRLQQKRFQIFFIDFFSICRLYGNCSFFGTCFLENIMYVLFISFA